MLTTAHPDAVDSFNRLKYYPVMQCEGLLSAWRLSVTLSILHYRVSMSWF